MGEVVSGWVGEGVWGPLHNILGNLVKVRDECGDGGMTVIGKSVSL